MLDKYLLSKHVKF